MCITVIGSVFVDIKAYPYGKFIPDGRNPGYDVQVHGGVGRNIAENLAHMGVDARFVALVDESGTGTDIINGLKDSGVDARFVGRSPSGMGKWIAVFDDTGDVAASISIRPDLSPMTRLIDEHHEEIFKDTESVILEIDIEEETVDRVFYYAKKYGKKVYCVVSVMSITLERKKFFPHVDCFICNLQEAEMLFGLPLPEGDIASIQKLVSSNIQAAGLKSIIVTLGKDGAVYCAADGHCGYCPACDAQLKDSTGAGDAFASGAFAAITRGRSFDEACCIGSETAGFVISSDMNVCPDFKRDIFGLNA